MKKQLILIICIAGAILTLSACGSTSSFEKGTQNELGALFLSDKVDMPTMVEAVKYGFKRVGLTLEKEEKQGENVTVLIAKLGSSMQSWGQHVKVTVRKAGAETKAFYVSKARVAMNVTEDTGSIKNNIQTYSQNYLEAAKEGIDLEQMTINTER